MNKLGLIVEVNNLAKYVGEKNENMIKITEGKIISYLNSDKELPDFVKERITKTVENITDENVDLGSIGQMIVDVETMLNKSKEVLNEQSSKLTKKVDYQKSKYFVTKEGFDNNSDASKK